MFPKSQRITKKSEFDLIYKKGQSFYLDALGVRVLKNNLNTRRFAIIVSTKISKKAVVRNKLKRRLRETLKKQQENLPPSIDLIVYTKKELLTLTFKDLGKLVSSLIAKIKQN